MPTSIQRITAQYMGKFRLFSQNARLILIVSFLTGLATGGYRLIFNFYALSLDGRYDESFLGTLQTAQSLAAILFALPVAYLAGRFAHKYLLLLTSLLTGAALLGVVTLPYAISLIFFRMLFGVAISAQEVVIAPFLMANTGEDERQWVFSFNFGMKMTAVFVGNTLGGSLPTAFAYVTGVDATSTAAYQFALGGLALLAMFSVIPLLRVQKNPLANTYVAELPWHLLRKHGRILAPFFIPNLIVGFGAGMMQPFMNLYFRSVYKQSDFVIGVVFAVGAISMAVAQFLSPPMADRLGKINAVILTQALSIPFLILLGIGAWVVPGGYGNAGMWFMVAVLAYNLRLAFMNMGNPIYQTFMLERVPDDVSALAVSLSSISFQFGWFVMPQISGWLQVRFGEYGFVPIFFSVAGFYLCAILAEVYFFRGLILKNLRG